MGGEGSWEPGPGCAETADLARSGEVGALMCLLFLKDGGWGLGDEWRFTLSHPMSQRQEAEIDLMTLFPVTGILSHL